MHYHRLPSCGQSTHTSYWSPVWCKQENCSLDSTTAHYFWQCLFYFNGVWETLCIFKVVRWIHNGCTKINKRPTVSSGIRTSAFNIQTSNFAKSLTLGTLTNPQSFIILDSKCEILLSRLPCGHSNKTRHSDVNSSDYGDNKLCLNISE